MSSRADQSRMVLSTFMSNKNSSFVVLSRRISFNTTRHTQLHLVLIVIVLRRVDARNNRTFA